MSAASVQNTDGSTRRPRSLVVERTAMRAISSSMPVRAATVLRCSSSRTTRAAPTLPQPKSPIRRGFTPSSYRPVAAGPVNPDPV